MGVYADVIFPWIFDTIEGPELGALREECARRAAGDVLEIGLGAGKTLPHYGPAVRSLTAIEPSAGMSRRAHERLKAVSFPTKLVPLAGESLPFEDASFDEAVVTLTLCSVADPDRVLAETHRVLRPGGRLHFLEHVASSEPRFRRLQNWLNPIERIIGCGCNLNRDTAAVIERAGFAFAEIERLISDAMPLYPPLFPLIRGIAVRR
jgi:ubiquinone/menaquinone biosynthesis C-methylase UbiE